MASSPRLNIQGISDLAHNFKAHTIIGNVILSLYKNQQLSPNISGFQWSW